VSHKSFAETILPPYLRGNQAFNWRGIQFKKDEQISMTNAHLFGI